VPFFPQISHTVERSSPHATPRASLYRFGSARAASRPPNSPCSLGAVARVLHRGDASRGVRAMTKRCTYCGHLATLFTHCGFCGRPVHVLDGWCPVCRRTARSASASLGDARHPRRGRDKARSRPVLGRAMYRARSPAPRRALRKRKPGRARRPAGTL
jgi:hypothetical protein